MAEEQNGDKTVSGEVAYTVEDFAQAYDHIPAFRRLQSGVYLLPLIWAIGIATTLLAPRGHGEERPEIPLHILLPSIFFVVLMVVGLRRMKSGWAQRAFKDTGSGKASFRFDADGYHSKSSLREAQVAWAALPYYLETPEAFLIYTSTQTVMVLPKRALDGASGVDALRALLAERIRQQPPGGGRPGMKLLIWVVALVVFLSVWHFLNLEAPP
jgi:hypothetical protein